MQREGQEEINLSRAFAEENSNLLTKASTPKKKAKRASIPNANY
jgi:hypothetical protein